jgi:hypothetical protein
VRWGSPLPADVRFSSVATTVHHFFSIYGYLRTMQKERMSAGI